MGDVILVAAKGEVVTRITRACERLEIETVVIDDGSFEGLSSAIAKHAPKAVHLGYGSDIERATVAARLRAAGVTVIAPTDRSTELCSDLVGLHARWEAATIRVTTEPHAHGREIAVLVAADHEGRVEPILDADFSLAPHLVESPSPEFVFRPDGEALQGAVYERAVECVEALEQPGLYAVNFDVRIAGEVFALSIAPGLPAYATWCEMATGIDLAQLQIDLAFGGALSDGFGASGPRGASIAACLRISQSTSASGTLEELWVPPSPQARLRVEATTLTDHAIDAADFPLIATLTAHERLRHRAMLSIDRTLAAMRLAPWQSNKDKLRVILSDIRFRSGSYDRTFLDTLD